MSIIITGDLDWSGALVLFLTALDGGPAADVAGYAFTTSGDVEYSAEVPEPGLPANRLLGVYRCVAKTAGGVIAGSGYVTIAAGTEAVRIRGEEAVELDSGALDPVLAAIAEIAAGGLTSEQALLLTQIAERTAQITGSRLSLAGAVTPGGRIQLIIGKDYVTAAENGLTRTISDPGGVLHARLIDADLSAVKRFGASRKGNSVDIAGTVTAVSHSANVTSVTIEIDSLAIPESLAECSDYKYMIERETVDGDKVVEISGDLTLLRRTV
jgi:hypothetical protein